MRLFVESRCLFHYSDYNVKHFECIFIGLKGSTKPNVYFTLVKVASFISEPPRCFSGGAGLRVDYSSVFLLVAPSPRVCVCAVSFPGVCLLRRSDVLLARPGQQRVRLLASGQTQRVQHDRLRG